MTHATTDLKFAGTTKEQRRSEAGPLAGQTGSVDLEFGSDAGGGPPSSLAATSRRITSSRPGVM
jgi:hypothetical protein